MINPLENQEISPLERGIAFLPGDFVPGIRGMPGDYPVGQRPLPGDYRFAGSKIKGLQQIDPTIFEKLFP